MIDFTIHKNDSALIKIKDFLNSNDVSVPDKMLSLFFEQLKDNLYFGLEFPYVDRVYRDTYYGYFSSKRKKYNRDCLRVSIFSDVIELSDFRSKSEFGKINKAFLGFFVIRPITKCIGRNIINPYALEKNDFFIRSIKTNVNINGVKLTAEGFPHCSQDAESMSCAETTIWSLLEYFGIRYHQYSTVLPSQIKSKSENEINERLLPSNGMSTNTISSYLDESGFNGRKYSSKTYNNNSVYFNALNTYIESGIPVILGFDNETFGHVVLAIGRKYIPKEKIISTVRVDAVKKVKLYDFDSAEKEIVIIDDNLPPYQLSSILKPTQYYIDKLDVYNWGKSFIDYFIVPLHKKIYLDAIEAKGCFFEFIEEFNDDDNDEDFQLDKTRENYMRFFLTTSRSLKENLLKNTLFDEVLKDLIIRYQLPQFVWIVEISDKDLFDNKKADGLVIIDATERDIDNFNPIIFAAANNHLLIQDPQKEGSSFLDFKKEKLYLQPFWMFNDNLKLYKN